jgi:N-acetylmuramoyl-L-alanine amidase
MSGCIIYKKRALFITKEIASMPTKTWLLDPGHGGIIDGAYQTAGKRSPKFEDDSVLYEGVFNRDVVSRILTLCLEHYIKAINLVDTQEDLSLHHRVAKANLLHKENRNSVYLSIHANAFGNGVDFNSARGISTFHHYKSQKGKKLATLLQEQLVLSTGFKNRGVKANETWANFYVLRKTNMPAVLSENGFMTNLEQAQDLMTPEMRQKIALAHFEMIMEIEKNGL